MFHLSLLPNVNCVIVFFRYGGFLIEFGPKNILWRMSNKYFYSAASKAHVF
jgi:hypothetical protein